ncbi:ATP-dependent_RNA helicase [Hexamita inflata]|uniref:ATP-dependent_RNA helicase n=1 Tax=Hexamita inflata TaxID=28002 RepID=A0ABP1GGE6_9EUKA
MSETKLFPALSSYNLQFPFDAAIYQKMKDFLVRNNLVIPKQLGSLNGVDQQILFNELCGFGFDPTDVQLALNTLFIDNCLLEPVPTIKDKWKSMFLKRMESHRSDLISLLLLTLPPAQIPSEFGGSKLSAKLRFISTTEKLEQDSTTGNIPILKANERKPRRWRKQAGDTGTVESAEQESILREQCIEVLSKTQLVSEPLLKPLAAAVNLNIQLCYLTAITSVMTYQKGVPRIPKELNNGSLQNQIIQLRKNELQLISVSGFNVYQCTETTDLKLRPKCYQDMDMWVVNYSLPFSPYVEVSIYFHLQNVEDVEYMHDFVDLKTIPEQPLIVDKQLWKQNLQFKGSYPLVIPYIDCHSKQLSSYGKAVLLKQLYHAVNNKKYNEQPILQALLTLADPQTENLFKQYEEILQASIQLSTLNTKKFSKEDLQDSYFMETVKKLSKAQHLKKQTIIPLSPFLFAYKELDQAIPNVQTTIQENHGNQQNNYLILEDRLVKFAEYHNQKLKHQEIKLQKQTFEYENRLKAPLQSISESIKQETYDKMIKTRNQDQYDQFLPQRQQLPIYQNKQQLMDAINENQVIILTAQTGTGKSSNLPQIIVEYSKKCRIMITQPRKIAAISLATRVAQESGFKLKQAVGYTVKGKAEYCEDTIILFCTIGTIVRKLINNISELQRYSHIIIDEVHERDISTDIFLGMIKNHYQEYAKKIELPKIIIMSATIDGEKFSNYFTGLKVGHFAIDGKQYKLQKYYLDDLLNIGIKLPLKTSRKKTDVMELDDPYDDYNDVEDIEDTVLTIQDIDQIDDFQVNNQLICQILSRKIYNSASVKGNVLVFLPGVFEITSLQQFMSKTQLFTDIDVLPCHSMISLDEQQYLFKHSNRNRVILATNMAEASVTLPNIIAVIDTGLERSVQYFPKLRKHVFSTKFVSKESAQQRAGRAGRVCDGFVYATYSQKTFASFDPYRKPEITTASLANACMQLCLLSDQYNSESHINNHTPTAPALHILSQPHIFLQQLLDAPTKSKIYMNIKELVDNNFCVIHVNNFKEFEQINENSPQETILTSFSTEIKMTKFGSETAFLPIEPIFGRILYYGSLFGMDPILAKQMVSIVSVGQSQVLKKINTDCINLEQSSDHLLLIKLFRKYLNKENLSRYQVNNSGLQSMRDTMLELVDGYDIDCSDKDIKLLIPILQIAMWPNLAHWTQGIFKMVKNSAVELKVHPSSLMFRQKQRLVMYNEQLITKQSYMTTCSPGSIVGLLFCCENAQVNFRNRTIQCFDLEFNIPPIWAVVLIQYFQIVKEYGVGYDLIKELMRVESQ